MSEDNPTEPTEPRRVTHEVCKRTVSTDTRFRVGRGDPDDDDDLLRLGTDGIVIIASVTMFEHEHYEPPGWVKRGIETQGWWIRHRKAPPTGLVFHGAVDWKVVAEGLAEAMTKRQKPTKAEQAALDNFGIALAEEALAAASHEHEGDSEEEEPGTEEEHDGEG